ncbi:hypothetical protein KC19_11G126100 [Ceratodon purpureus]|uniref:RING-type E3 ubiquitin transferase n=1 Tax=Ceratodon purpureus TaxID=3225 RepID=A0A8T0GGE8_CERPU|nr:hypothetical protein KC19_11G126100 [Ceratodon purpureus]
MTAGFRKQVEDVQPGVMFFNVNATSPPNNRPSRPYYNPPGGTAGGSYFPRSLNSNVVVAMVVLLVALVVAAFVNTVVRYVLRRRRLQRIPETQNVPTVKGLDKSVIEALPVVAYGVESLKSVFDPAGDNECVVCLSEFVHGENLRLLPKCQHAFHVGCIDAWLVTHKTCPVCRSNVVSGESEADPSRARSVALGGSARFGSARIASVDIESDASGQSARDSAAADPTAAAASSSTSRPNRTFRSILPTEAMAIIIHGALGPRRFGLRSQGRV